MVVPLDTVVADFAVRGAWLTGDVTRVTGSVFVKMSLLKDNLCCLVELGWRSSLRNRFLVQQLLLKTLLELSLEDKIHTLLWAALGVQQIYMRSYPWEAWLDCIFFVLIESERPKIRQYLVLCSLLPIWIVHNVLWVRVFHIGQVRGYLQESFSRLDARVT